MSLFEGMALHFGVLYPMQTFSKSKLLNFNEIPCFVEGNDDFAFETVNSLAGGISSKVYLLNSEARKHLHLAAVLLVILLIIAIPYHRIYWQSMISRLM